MPASSLVVPGQSVECECPNQSFDVTERVQIHDKTVFVELPNWVITRPHLDQNTYTYQWPIKNALSFGGYHFRK